MTTNDQKKEYIRLKLLGCIDSKNELIKEFKIEDISLIKPTIEKYIQDKLKISKEDFLELQRNEGKIITFIKGLFKGEKRTKGFEYSIEKFYYWYISQPDECCYCGVKTKDLVKYFSEENTQYKSAKRKRGKVLEIERVVTSPTNDYSELNCKLACYICNNAKSDFISPSAFKPIAKGIYDFWTKKVGLIDIEFPENSIIWKER